MSEVVVRESFTDFECGSVQIGSVFFSPQIGGVEVSNMCSCRWFSFFFRYFAIFLFFGTCLRWWYGGHSLTSVHGSRIHAHVALQAFFTHADFAQRFARVDLLTSAAFSFTVVLDIVREYAFACARNLGLQYVTRR